MKRIEINENGILMLFEVTEEQKVKLLHFSVSPLELSEKVSARIFEITEN